MTKKEGKKKAEFPSLLSKRHIDKLYNHITLLILWDDHLFHESSVARRWGRGHAFAFSGGLATKTAVFCVRLSMQSSFALSPLPLAHTHSPEAPSGWGLWTLLWSNIKHCFWQDTNFRKEGQIWPSKLNAPNSILPVALNTGPRLQSVTNTHENLLPS